MQIVLLVLDSAGIGSAPDADGFGDGGANTLAHTIRRAGSRRALPHLAQMGLDALIRAPGLNAPPGPRGRAVRLHPQANGKDSLAGHWEMMRLSVSRPFPTYPDGFPTEVVDRLAAAWGCQPLGNVAASGTEIIERLGTEHLASGRPILYTSADSVLQIAAHEEVVPLATLYRWCESAREVMRGEHEVGRVIARPFVGQPGRFVRTAGRHDYAVAPPSETTVDRLGAAGVGTLAIGKIGDIFCQRGFDAHWPTRDNGDGLEKIREAMGDKQYGLVFANLVDFDAKWGHRRDPKGYMDGLLTVDEFLPALWEQLGPDDQLWITADHGCDPTYTGSDHTREDVPWLMFGSGVSPGTSRAAGFGVIGHTLEGLFSKD